MKKGYTHIVGVLDASGSVASIIDDMRGGYNAYLDEKKGDFTVTTVIFNNFVRILDNFSRVADASRLTKQNYFANGSTALYDAIGTAIDSTGKRLAEMPENQRPEHVIVYINTDGYENASQDYKHAQIAEMIKHQQDVYNWTFLFVGANIDAPAVASTFNIPISNSFTYTQTSESIGQMYRAVNCAVKQASTGQAVSFDSLNLDKVESK